MLFWGRGQEKDWTSNIFPLHLKESGNLYLLVKTVLDFQKDRGDTEETRVNLEYSAAIYFRSCHMSRTVTLLIAHIIHAKLDRPYINPVIFIYTASIYIHMYPLGIRSSWLLSFFHVFQPFFPTWVPLLIMWLSSTSPVCTFCQKKKKKVCFLLSCATVSLELCYLNQ